MRYRTMAMLLLMGNGLVFTNCRNTKDGTMETQMDAPHDDEDLGPPDTERSPSPFMEPDAAPDVQTSPGNPEYVTDLLVYAGCSVDGADVPVANGHAEPGECEHIVVTPAHNDDGDFYEVAAPFVWITTNPTMLPIACLNGEHDNFCWPVGLGDLFDPGQVNEPSAAITACAQNDCPIPRPADCADEVCVSFTAASVVSIEGTWSLSGETFDPGATMAPEQDGRSFDDHLVGVKRGEIDAWSLHFEIDDYLYTGGFTDRGHIVGDVSDSISGAFVAEWSAVRIGP